ncbi:MAG: noncanonical pyrimidine nucleotidase, YjjG family [Flavobacteriales bacterium]|nr:noncanonical pyrimidine nucleotidase, YjjG family [Flavobacteriales bacterium]
MTNKYKHIFFDLDHTLWDFETNSRITLEKLFDEHRLNNFGVPDFQTFIEHYEKTNEQLWEQYRKGEIDKTTIRNERFPTVLREWNIDSRPLCNLLSEQYLDQSPKQGNLMPNALTALNYLSEKYTIHLITNGFKEVQHTKLLHSGLHNRFDTITTSEEVGFLKPDKRVFHHALRLANAHQNNSIYVGDHIETDVLGGKNAGMDTVFFNPQNAAHPKIATFEILDLAELMEVL